MYCLGIILPHYFSHEEHEEAQRNTNKDERRREIYVYEKRKIMKNLC